MKRFGLLLATILIPAITFADVVTEQEALQKARQFMPDKSFKQLQKSDRAPMRDGQSETPAYYVFNADNNDGFVIVSADDRTSPVLGYSDNGHIDETDMPDNMKAWLNTYKEIITSLRSTPEAPSSPYVSPERQNIEPLLQSHWGQHYPYNLLCPLYEGKRCLTGCVATAMAQIMYYHKWPIGETTSIPSYTSSTLTLEELSPTAFDWDIIKPDIQGSDESNYAVAKLMQYCSQSIKAEYNPIATAARSKDVPNALSNYFGYSKGLSYISRDEFTDIGWEEIIINELKANRPVYYDGFEEEKGGHAWVCDGIKDGYFHMNWGWDGQYDGYFLLSILDSSGHKRIGHRYIQQKAIVGIKPIDDTDIGLSFDNDGYHYTVVDEGAVSIQNIDGETYTGENGILTLPSYVTYNDVTYSIVEIGESNGFSSFEYSEIILPSTLKRIVPKAIFIIKGTTIEIPESVNFIARTAFDRNSDLSSIVVEEGNTHYKSVDGVLFTADGEELLYYPKSKIGSEYDVPDGVKRIGHYAFQGIHNITKINLPQSMERIGEYAFSNCTNLEEINLPDNITEIGSSAFAGCHSINSINIPTNLEYIPSHTFDECPLTSIICKVYYPINLFDPAFDYNIYNNATLYVPTGTGSNYKASNAWGRFTRIEEMDMKGVNTDAYKYIFFDYTITSENTVTITGKGDYSLCGKIAIPDSITLNGHEYMVTKIKTAVNYASDLTSLIIPETIDTIENAFIDLPNLEYVYIPKNVKYIYFAFVGCSKLTIDVDDNNSHYFMKDGGLYSRNMKQLVIVPEKLNKKNFIIPEGVECIDFAFCDNSTIESVYIPSTIKKCKQSFDFCINLKTVKMSDHLSTISGFLDCESLEEIMLPINLSRLEYPYCFEGCSSLKKIFYLQEEPFAHPFDYEYVYSFHDTIFDKTTLIVPPGCIDKYKSTSVWSSFKKIEEYSDNDKKWVTIDNLSYICSTDSKTAMLLKCDTAISNLTIPESVEINGDNYAITLIGPSALEMNPLNAGITSVTIPEGVNTIGAYCFFYDNIKQIELPSTLKAIGKRAFFHCSDLSYVTARMEEPVDIAEDTFEGLPSLATLVVPIGAAEKYKSAPGWNKFATIVEGETKEVTIDGLTYYAYTGPKIATIIKGVPTTSELILPSSITVDGTDYAVTVIGISAFESSSIVNITIPEGVKGIGRHAFRSCTSLKMVKLPSSIKIIEDWAFYACYNPFKIELPSTEIIGERAFSQCGLSEITIPEGVKVIGEQAFEYCSLIKVELPSTLETIGKKAFSDCTNLSYVTARMEEPVDIAEDTFEGLPSSATLFVPIGATENYKSALGWNKFATIVEGEIKETTIDGLTYYLYTGPKSTTIFKGEPSTSDPIIPASITVDGTDYAVTEIGNYAFKNSSIVNITIPEGVKTIGENAFSGCLRLKKVQLPSTIEKIGDYAFYNCNNLTTVISKDEEPCIISENVFVISGWKYDGTTFTPTINPTNATLYVPIGKTATYQATDGWNKFPAIVEGEIKEVTIDGLTYEYVTGPKIATLIKSVAPDYSEIDSLDIIIPPTITVEGTEYNVTKIGEYAFRSNIYISYIKIPEGVTEIRDYAFDNCSHVELIELPSTLTHIGYYAFRGTNNLKYVNVGMNEPFSINDGVFPLVQSVWGAEGLNQIPSKTILYVPTGTLDKYKNTAGWDKLNNYREGSVRQASIDGMTYWCFSDSSTNAQLKLIDRNTTAKNLTIPSTITVNDQQFAVTAIDINTSSMGYEANHTVKNISISEGITSINFQAFRIFEEAQNIVLPSTLTSIAPNAFSRADTIISHITNPFAIDEYTFGAGCCQLYVPIGTVAKYQTTSGWNECCNNIEEDLATISANSYTIDYGQALPALNYIHSGVPIKSGTPVITCSATNNSSVGIYPIEINCGNVITITNGLVNCINGTLSINKAKLTVIAKSYTIMQGDSLPDFEITFSGFKNGEDTTVLAKVPIISITATSTSEPGVYDIIVSGGEAQNYNFIYVKGKLTIEANNTDISEISIDSRVSIYTLSGTILYDNVNIQDAYDQMPSGIYIIRQRDQSPKKFIKK